MDLHDPACGRSTVVSAIQGRSWEFDGRSSTVRSTMMELSACDSRI